MVPHMQHREKDPYLTGKLLLAMPNLGDPRFNRAVIFICAHDEKGAMGLVINHVLPGLEFSDLLKQLKIASDIHVGLESLHMPVLSGGPVESSRGFLLHSDDFRQKETVTIAGNYSVTGTLEALKEIVRGKGPEKMLFILGYAGWDAGQLEHEIQDNAWLVTDANPDIIFGSSPEHKWNKDAKTIGIKPGMLSHSAGRA